MNLLRMSKDNDDINYSLLCIINSVTCKQFPAGCSEKHLSSSAEPVTNPNLQSHNHPHARLKLQLMHKTTKTTFKLGKCGPSYLLDVIVKSSNGKIRNIFILSQSLGVLQAEKKQQKIGI